MNILNYQTKFQYICIYIFTHLPFPSSCTRWDPLANNSISILEGIIRKISYERRDYESVDEKSLSYAISPKNDEKRIYEVTG